MPSIRAKAISVHHTITQPPTKKAITVKIRKMPHGGRNVSTSVRKVTQVSTTTVMNSHSRPRLLRSQLMIVSKKSATGMLGTCQASWVAARTALRIGGARLLHLFGTVRRVGARSVAVLGLPGWLGRVADGGEQSGAWDHPEQGVLVVDHGKRQSALGGGREQLQQLCLRMSRGQLG